MAKKRVFISFDFDNDRVLKEFIIGQTKLPDSSFEVIDTSLKEAAPMSTWEQKAERAIRDSDLVLVMVGPATHRANGVLKEMQFARTWGKRVVQVNGYRGGSPPPVAGAGPLLDWNWENLKRLFG